MMKINRHRIFPCLALAAAIASFGSFVHAEGNAATAPVRDLSYCGTVPISTPRNDYRLHNTDAMKWGYDDNMRAHTRPAIDRIRAGEFSHRVIADLSWTLLGWPNHLEAL